MIETDASKDGLGACLLQEGHPVAYASSSLTASEQNCRCVQIEKELMAIVFACEKFHQYVYGQPVKIVTDHKPLESCTKTNRASGFSECFSDFRDISSAFHTVPAPKCQFQMSQSMKISSLIWEF